VHREPPEAPREGPAGGRRRDAGQGLAAALRKAAGGPQRPNEPGGARARHRLLRRVPGKHSTSSAGRARYKSYRGFVDEVEETTGRSKAHPPYINHIVETTLASPRRRQVPLPDPKPRLTLDTYPRPERESARARARGAPDPLRLAGPQGQASTDPAPVQPPERHRRPHGREDVLDHAEGAPPAPRAVEEPLTRRERRAALHPVTGEPMTLRGRGARGDDGRLRRPDDRGPRRPRLPLARERVSLEKARYVIDRVWMTARGARGDQGGPVRPRSRRLGREGRLELLGETRGFKRRARRPRAGALQRRPHEGPRRGRARSGTSPQRGHTIANRKALLASHATSRSSTRSRRSSSARRSRTSSGSPASRRSRRSSTSRRCSGRSRTSGSTTSS
jgi:hypothetical protein